MGVNLFRVEATSLKKSGTKFARGDGILLKNLLNIIVSGTLCAAALPATTIGIGNSYSSTLTNPGSETYTLNTLGNSGIQSSTFSNNPLSLTSSAAMTYSGYLGSVPVGDSITGATLDFSVLTGSAVFIPTGTAFYTPVFGGTLGALTVTIQSGAVSHTVSGASLTGYDLFANGFSAPILAGTPLSLSFSAGDTLAANTTTYGNNCKNCAETLSLTDTRSISGSETANILHLTTLTSVPEPRSTSLACLAIGTLGFLRMRKSRDSKRKGCTATI